jgi:tetratricopeptide (TPR) repeat protein
MFHKDGQYAEAEKRYRKALETNPNDNQLRFALIRLLVDAGEFDKILAMARELGGGKGPDGKEVTDFQILVNLGMMLNAQRSLDQAVATFRKATELDPDDEGAALKLGGVLGQKGDYEACIEHLEKIRKKWPDSGQIAYNLALAYKQVDRIEDTVALLNEIIQKNPDMVQALSLLSMIRASSPKDELRNGDEALQLAKKACALTRNEDPMALQSLAAAYAEKGMFEEAIEAGTKAANLAMAAGRKFMARNIHAIVMQFYRKQQPFRDIRPGQEPENAGQEPENAGQEPEGNP